MTEREALLKAVCDYPDDDTPRLVLADWLQENGEEERAEFIRLQIQLHRGQFRPDEHAALRWRLEKLDAHHTRWKREFPKAEGILYERGFIKLACILDDADVGRAMASAPVRSLRIRGPVDLLRVMSCSLLRRLECLDLDAAELRTGDVEAVLACDWPDRPKRLRLPRSAAAGDLRGRVLARFEWVSISRF